MPNETLPTIQPTLRVIPMVYDTNARGDIFGGWLMSQIDTAGATVAAVRAKGPVATIAVNELTFRAPLYVGDVVSFYAKVVATGTKSLTVEVDVFAERNRQLSGEVVRISHASLVYVAVSEPGKSRVIPA
ncbi:MAG TPA: acyl-CoA thioesterase [Gammaproteobacteria bacterium]|nr:acyl-CoA thioesterase [Gammaproteobacteria bacterium]